MRIHSSFAAAIAGAGAMLFATSAVASDWIQLGDFAYDQSSVHLDAKTGGSLIFRAPPDNSLWVLRTYCDGSAAWAPLAATPHDQAVIFRRTYGPLKAGTVMKTLYNQICS